MEEKNKKKATILIVVAVIVLLITGIGITLAYFIAQGGEDVEAPTTVSTNTTDSLTFAIDKDLSISASANNFGSGGNNISDTAVVTATLKANNSTNSATYHYDIYLDMGNNSFVYTTEDNKPELMLTITDPNGNEVTTLGDLTYTTIKGVSGFDVTTTTGSIAIASNYEISTTSTKIDNWHITLTLINLDTDQNANAGKIISGKLSIKKTPPYHEKCNDSSLACQVAKLYTEDGANNLYYHDGVGTYTNASLEAGDNSYRYAGSSDTTNNYVCFGSSEATCPAENLYRIIGVFDDDGDGTYNVKLISANFATSTMLGGSSVSSDYSGAGSFNSSYPYRGTTSSFNTYYWNKENYNTAYSATNYYNDWSYSSLNTKHLNDYYLNTYLGSTWSNKIATTTWKVGGMAFSETNTAKQYYDAEITNPSTQVVSTYNSKVALMYVSDYGYAASPDNWTKALNDYNDYGNSTNRYNNWLYLAGDSEFTLARDSFWFSDALGVGFYGGVSWVSDVSSAGLGVRPSFSLESTIELSRGSGTISSPYRIS